MRHAFSSVFSISARRKSIVFIFGFAFISIFFILLAKFILIPRIGAFGCFDDCFNFVAGYFLGKGRMLYSEIFFNHQMLPAYISYVTQRVYSPQTVYELVRKHREVLLAWSWGMNILLFYRFGPAALGFTVMYELSKYYVFGDRFLAEAFIVYPLAYCTGLVLKKAQGEALRWYDSLIAALFTWFVIFSREPFIPVSILMFGYIIWSKKYVRIQIVSFFVFSFISLVTLLVHPIRDYYFQVVEVNKQLMSKLDQIDIFSIVFYPIILFFGDTLNVFRSLAIGHSIVYLTLTVYGVVRKDYKRVLLLFFILALANIRYVAPGKIFYEAFHLAPWWGIFIFAIWQLLWDMAKGNHQKAIVRILFVILIIAGAQFVMRPSSYIYEKVDRHVEFTTNYANDYVYGEFIRLFADPDDTVFLDGWDDLIYWQSGKVSPYQYSWYTSSMPYFNLFTDARIRMFRTRPPDFYYGSCEKSSSELHILPEDVRSSYKRIAFSGKPTCLYVRSISLSEIPEERYRAIEHYNFSIVQ